jgi:hypothetical protein
MSKCGALEKLSACLIAIVVERYEQSVEPA